jgi:hypothetical protein
MLCDEWFEDFLNRCQRTAKRQRVLADGVPRPRDARLRAEREYDAETERMTRRIHWQTSASHSLPDRYYYYDMGRRGA